MNTIWVITFAVNEYDQQGDYLDRVFVKKPTEKELNSLGYDGKHLLKGGGRKDTEYLWYFLTELKPGEEYQHS